MLVPDRQNHGLRWIDLVENRIWKSAEKDNVPALFKLRTSCFKCLISGASLPDNPDTVALRLQAKRPQHRHPPVSKERISP